MLKTLRLVSSYLLITLIPSVAGINFHIASSASCSGNTLQYNNVHAFCTNQCEAGDTVTATGYVVASSDFSDSTVTLRACITGPFNSVCLYRLDPVTVGTVCNWITSETVYCGNAADDYYLSKTYTIPEYGAPQNLRWITGVKVKAWVGDFEECESSSSYQMAAAAVLFVGAAALFRKRRLRLAVSEDKKVALLEMPDMSSKGVEEGVAV